jgi:hypothetical protein
MNRHVSAVASRLSLRPPQRRSLEILDRITEIAPPGKGADTAAAANFERHPVCIRSVASVTPRKMLSALLTRHGQNVDKEDGRSYTPSRLVMAFESLT